MVDEIMLKATTLYLQFLYTLYIFTYIVVFWCTVYFIPCIHVDTVPMTII